MSYSVSCHCGNIRLQVEGEPEQGLACNCSICQRKGSLLWFLPPDKVEKLSAENEGTYTFNKHQIQHRFCKTCGMHPYGEGVDPSGQAMMAINLRCAEDLDPDAVPVRHVDGRAL